VSLAGNRIAGLALAAAVFVADFAIKAWVTGGSVLREPMDVLPFFRLAYTENTGVSLGFLRADSDMSRWLLLGGTALIALGVLVWLLRERRLGDVLPLGLVLGGALGNIADRATRGFVVDYADFHVGDWTPFIFNLADAAISVGVVIILARSLFWGQKPAAQNTASSHAAKTAPET
jgi:signal peptidase II